MDQYHILIVLSLILILSHYFTFISKAIRIPSVLLLLATGIGLKSLGAMIGYQFEVPMILIKTLGSIGLILIVLEGSFDIEFRKKKMNLLLKSLWVSGFTLIALLLVISSIIYIFTHEPLMSCLLYGAALSVMSSAIVIPSLRGISKEKKEFMIYNSTFSDILGIILFNAIVLFGSYGVFSFLTVTINFIGTLIVSIIVIGLLLIYLQRFEDDVFFFLIIAVLMLLFGLGKLLHFSPLLLVFFFGWILANIRSVPMRFRKIFNVKHLHHIKIRFNGFLNEASFVVRTLFFVIFGYSINISEVGNLQVLWVGGVILVAIYLLNMICLRLILKKDVVQYGLIAPRGLVTILLFSNIPEAYKVNVFGSGLVFFIILSTSIIMMVGMMSYKEDEAVIP